MITVIGATGKTGQHVVTGLTDQGIAVRALVRDTAKAQGLLPAETDLVVGDLTDRSAVRRAVAGADKVYLAIGGREDQQQLEASVVDEVAAAGVGHLVKISVPAPAPDSPSRLGRWHAAVEQRIAAAAIPTTILRPNWFIQNFLGAAATVASHNTLYAAADDGAIAPIDARDIAESAVVVLTEDGHVGEDYYLTGPESLTYAQIASRIGSAIGRDVGYVNLPDEALLSALLEAALPRWYAAALVELMGRIREQHFAEVSPVVDKLLGREARSLENFVRENAAAFSG
jgi:uncharacterized protein YbjT (DUF2867 family)